MGGRAGVTPAPSAVGASPGPRRKGSPGLPSARLRSDILGVRPHSRLTLPLQSVARGPQVSEQNHPPPRRSAVCDGFSGGALGVAALASWPRTPRGKGTRLLSQQFRPHDSPPSSSSVPSSTPSLRIQGRVGGLRPVSGKTVDSVDPMAAFRGEGPSPSHAGALRPPGLDSSRRGQQRADQTRREEFRPAESAAGKGSFQTLPTGHGPALTHPSWGARWGAATSLPLCGGRFNVERNENIGPSFSCWNSESAHKTGNLLTAASGTWEFPGESASQRLHEPDVHSRAPSPANARSPPRGRHATEPTREGSRRPTGSGRATSHSGRPVPAPAGLHRAPPGSPQPSDPGLTPLGHLERSSPPHAWVETSAQPALRGGWQVL